MLKKAIIFIAVTLMMPTIVFASSQINIEIFDIGKSTVVKEVKSTPEIQKEAENYLKGIKGLYVKLSPIPLKGFMIKIPFETPVLVQNEYLKDFVEQVILIFPEQQAPYLLFLDEDQRPQVYYFKGETDNLLKMLDYQKVMSEEACNTIS